MTIITKGMGAIIKGALKKGAKKLSPPYKTNIPFYATVAGVDVGRRAYNKLTKAKDPHEGTLSGAVIGITKAIKKKNKE